jgi:hypothetical protein
LHQADLANRSDSVRIVCAFDLRHCVSYFSRKTPLLGFLADEPYMPEAANGVRFRHPEQTLNRRREWESGEV